MTFTRLFEGFAFPCKFGAVVTLAIREKKKGGEEGNHTTMRMSAISVGNH